MKGNWLIKVLITILAFTFGGISYADTTDKSQMAQLTQAQEQVNINDADAQTIQRVLVGVGRSKAEAIVAYREANGRFYSLEELLEVKGIGKSTLAKNSGRIIID
ncbi:MAG: ComEA family DNA-binding protein [Pseudomonadales bacterium]|jgi:competence protein ComEA|nr:ComEA family DNA-binding protein [Pseudomonadales bacterium]MDP7145442.1 ComEA family DNA-binding protein [Pseudomonadales bacterium]MDP7595414.1 ComEA family DNA-binding protein [Pseudomonadales bacterium]|tara:strand:- start:1981 stop:2295 length:315 start_codon:yes stop_codon:yes gene_type:complete